MIVVVSDNAEVTGRISALLKQKGDLFMVTSDEPQAFAEIRADRATLMVVDTSSSAFNGFALCASVKNDPDLAGLPVLCLVEVTDLSSILSVLDCTADGFLTPPFDLSSLSAAIGDLQDRQAEGTAQGSVQTLFRVNHDGREFTVVADRRQLLEFLLAAFESAIRMRQEQERIRAECRGELRTLGGHLSALTAERDATVASLHRELDERNKRITAAVETLAEKEQAEELLQTRFENVAQELRELGAALEATRKSEEEKSRRIADLESDKAAEAVERKCTEEELTTRVNTLQEQLTEATLGRDSARSTVAALDVRIAEMERQLVSATDELTQNKETVRSLNSDLAQMTWVRNTQDLNCRALEETLEQTRAAARSKEKEFKAAIDDMTDDLHSIQTALEQNLQQLDQELTTRKDREQEVMNLTKERDALSGARDMLQEKLTLVQGVYEKEVSASGAREQEFKSALDSVNNDLHSIQGALEQNLRQLERELTARKDLEREVEGLIRERDALLRDVSETQAGLADLKARIAAEEDSRRRAELECTAIRTEHERLQGMLRDASRDLERMQEENRALSAAEERERTVSLQVSGLKEQIERLTGDLAAGREAIRNEEQKRAEAESEREALKGEYANARKFLDSASRDIGILNATLEEERRVRKAAEDRLSASERECAEKNRIISSLHVELETTRSAAGVKSHLTESQEEKEVPPPTVSPPPPDVEDAPAKETMQEPGLPTEESPAVPSPSPPGDEGVTEPPALSVQIALPPPESRIPLPVTEIPAPAAGTETGQETPAAGPEDENHPAQETRPLQEPGGPAPHVPPRSATERPMISRDRWLDIIKWAHHAEALTPEVRKGLIADLMRLSKLVQKGRHLTNRQDQEIRALVARVQAMGYRFV